MHTIIVVSMSVPTIHVQFTFVTHNEVHHIHIIIGLTLYVLYGITVNYNNRYTSYVLPQSILYDPTTNILLYKNNVHCIISIVS